MKFDFAAFNSLFCRATVILIKFVSVAARKALTDEFVEYGEIAQPVIAEAEKDIWG